MKINPKYLFVFLSVMLLLPFLASGQAEQKDAYYEATKQKVLGKLDKAAGLFESYLQQYPDDAAAMYELADIYINQNMPERALPLAEKAVAADGSNKWYKLMLVQLYQGTGKYGEAKKMLEGLLEEEPGDLSYLEQLALNSLYTGDYKAAIRYYDQIEEIIGVNEEVTMQKEKIYLMMGKPDKAIAEVEKLVASDPGEPRYYEMLAEVCLSSQEFDKALAAYNKILEIEPDNPYINISLSDYYRKKGDQSKSFEYLKAGFANPNLNIDTKVQILLAYYSVNEIYGTYKEDAFQLSQILVNTHPDDPKAYSIYGDLLYQDKRFQEARDAFLMVISLDSTKYLVWEQLIFTEWQLGNYREMETESVRAMLLFPQQPLVYLGAGTASYQLKKYDEAARYFRTGINFVVNNDELLTQFYAALGDAYYQLKDLEKCFEVYEKVLKVDPANTVVLNNYAYYLSLEGRDLEKAETMAKQAVELDPGNGANQDTYGWVLYRQGKYEEAREWIGKAIESREESAVVLEHYGDVLFKLGEKKEALKWWEKALKAGEGSEFLEKKVRDKTLYE